MEIRTCRECHHIFQYSGYDSVLCPQCKQKDDECFEKVKKYLQTHPNAQGQDVFTETGVPMTRITRWLREERLMSSDTSACFIKCKTCGKPIKTGELCSECKVALGRGFADAGLNPMRPKSSLKENSSQNKGMRFIGTRK